VTLRTQAALAGVILMALCGVAQAKSGDCGCHLRAKAIHHAAPHRASTHQRSYDRHAYASHGSKYDAYDYDHARAVNEDVYHMREGAWRDGRYESRDHENQYSYGNRDHQAQADRPPTSLNGRDFSGGVGYGQNGDMGTYQGGYGRFDPYNGNTAAMNGGAMNDRARMSVWHGYNSHNGLGNGY